MFSMRFSKTLIRTAAVRALLRSSKLCNAIAGGGGVVGGGSASGGGGNCLKIPNIQYFSDLHITDYNIHAHIVYERSMKREWLKHLHNCERCMRRKVAMPIVVRIDDDDDDGIPVIPFTDDDLLQNQHELIDLMYRTGFKKQYTINSFEYLNSVERFYINGQQNDDNFHMDDRDES